MASRDQRESTDAEKRDRAQRQIDRGEHARRLLNDPMLQEAFQEIDNEIIEKWRQSAGDEHEQRHNAYLMQRLLTRLKSYLEEVVNTGEFGKRDLLFLKDKQDSDTENGQENTNG